MRYKLAVSINKFSSEPRWSHGIAGDRERMSDVTVSTSSASCGPGHFCSQGGVACKNGAMGLFLPETIIQRTKWGMA